PVSRRRGAESLLGRSASGYPGWMRFVRSALVLGILTVALAVPLAVLAGGRSKSAAAPTFVFGRTGGNIAPFSVHIGADGRVTTKGAVAGTPPATPLSSPL